MCAFAHVLACGKDGSCHTVAFLEFAAQTLRFDCALSRTSLPAARMGSTAEPAHASEERSDECGGSPLKNLILFFSKDKNQIEKFPLSDFFPDYNLL